ncbi:MAG: hypothetical protein EBU59_07905 [Planctomycetia bacterium]|nr:hypothetical protein [Planctomycetia bacterium]
MPNLVNRSEPESLVISSRSSAAVCPSPWIPWLIAPLFVLLPILGCWLTAGMSRQTVNGPSASTARAAQPVVTMVTAVTAQ